MKEKTKRAKSPLGSELTLVQLLLYAGPRLPNGSPADPGLECLPETNETSGLPSTAWILWEALLWGGGEGGGRSSVYDKAACCCLVFVLGCNSSVCTFT